MADYLYPNDHAAALARLRALERIEDDHTLEELRAVGVRAGWHCLEVGAGAGSIAYWLAEQAGPDGRVVATDLQPRLLDSGRCEVWRHDVSRDPLPPAAFDLAHMRHVLVHIPRAEHAPLLSRLWGTLRPGGILLLEESDFTTWQVSGETPEPLRSHGEAAIRGILALYRERGMDVHLGRHLARLAREAGFQVTRTTRRARSVAGASDEARFHQTTFRQLADSVSESRPAFAAAVEALVEGLADPRLAYTTRTTVAVTAQRG